MTTRPRRMSYDPSTPGTLAKIAIDKFVDPRYDGDGRSLADLPDHLQSRIFDSLLEKRKNAEERLTTIETQSYRVDARCLKSRPKPGFSLDTQKQQVEQRCRQLINDMGGATFIDEVAEDHHLRTTNLRREHEKRARGLVTNFTQWVEETTTVYGQIVRLLRFIALYVVVALMKSACQPPDTDPFEEARPFFSADLFVGCLLGSVLGALWALLYSRKACNVDLVAESLLCMLASPRRYDFPTPWTVAGLCPLVLLIPYKLSVIVEGIFPGYAVHNWTAPYPGVTYLRPVQTVNSYISSEYQGIPSSMYCLNTAGQLSRCQISSRRVMSHHDWRYNHRFWHREISAELMLKRLRYLAPLPHLDIADFDFRLRFADGSYVRFRRYRPNQTEFITENYFDELEVLFVGDAQKGRQWTQLLNFLISTELDHLP